MVIKKYSLEQIISLDPCSTNDFNHYCISNSDYIVDPFISKKGLILYNSNINPIPNHRLLTCSHPFWYRDIFNPGQLISVDNIIYQIGLCSISDKFFTDFDPQIGGRIALKPI